MGEARGSLTRRALLQMGWRALAVSGTATLWPDVGRGVAGAATAGSGRAVVCIYLFGGADTNSLVLPLELAQYTAYATARGELGLPAGAALPVTAAKTRVPYGLHPALEELKHLYDARVLAVVANVGSLEVPVTQASFRAKAVALPSDLMVHQYRSLRYVSGGFAVPRWATGAGGWDPSGAHENIFKLNTGMTVVGPAGFRLPGGPLENPELSRAITDAQIHTHFPETGLGQQLHQVVSLLQAAGKLGMRSQVFLCSLGGFDTHSQEVDRQAALFRELSQAMAAFYDATVEMGIANRVTTYTDSEFNRSMRPNANHGTEHAWGSHHLVMGGSVLGGDVYGKFPNVTLDGPQDATGNGVWIPTTSRDQYEATLAYWAGARYADLPGLFPRLRAFRPWILGFMA